ncbi:hypothetical protein IFM46972_11576 [Aspergillus udagawae]|uniref:Uncharacterized protein n=1 Tax=Aspergillus udagawae TaxID=91492 RepID=A0A8H3SHN8_9EURO|nr:hypothetical protein IFM46972_11576 [Aspergillus udagawae]
MIILVTGNNYLIITVFALAPYYNETIITIIGWFTYLITTSYGGSNTCVCFNTRRYYGYSRSIFINEIITFNRI